jgi:hypothetical protein
MPAMRCASSTAARARQGRGLLAREVRGCHRSEADGCQRLKDDLPPITTFLNRLLALTIDLQNVLFTAFEQLLNAKIEGAVASGTYDVGLETLQAESLVVTDRRTIYDHPAPGRDPAAHDHPAPAQSSGDAG